MVDNSFKIYYNILNDKKSHAQKLISDKGILRMKNKSYFGIFQKNKKLLKRILISILIVLIIFIPSFLIALNYFSEKDATSGDEITVSVYKGETLLFSESEIRQNALPTSLVSIFDSILNGLTEMPSANADTASAVPLLITHTFKGYTSNYTCYFFTDGSDRNFLIRDNGEYYKISQSDAMLFLTSPYAESLYPASVIPKLYTSADDEITPESAEWFYKNASSKYIEAAEMQTSAEQLTYDMAGALGIAFDIAPDECNIEVYKSGIIFSKIEGTDLSGITVTPGTVLNFKITATWKQSQSSDFYGTIEYNFDAILRDRADFILDKTSLQVGDFIVLACTNVIDYNKIEFSATPDISFTPEYFESNGAVYALIPFSSELPVGTYTLSFTYGAASETINVFLSPNESENIILTPDQDRYFASYTSTKALAEFEDILNFEADSLPDHVYFDGAFTDYTKEGATEKYTFGTSFKNFEETKEYTLSGTLFEFEDQSGAPIKAANNGRVINCGYSDHIGSFVVIEHGLGLKTVYGHLGALNVSVGDVVLRGQSIGRSGKINGSDKDHLLLLTYLFDLPVDYSSIAGEELFLYVPEQLSEE